MNAVVKRLELEVGEESPEGAPLVARDVRLVSGVEVEVEALLGSSRVTLERLFALKAGELVELDAAVDEPVLLRVAGKAVARGTLVAVGDRLGIQVTEVGQ